MNDPHLRVAVVGCGLIGQKRVKALGNTATLTVACDVFLERARAFGVAAENDWRAAVTRQDVDVVIVSTVHNQLARIAAEAAAAGKHVLIEKPGACRATELDPVLAESRRTGSLVRIGFNHRYHRAFRKAREIFDSGALGPMMFIRARYGHGGRPGYNREWRADGEQSGGGELVDQGVHLIDLARCFLGDFVHVQGQIATYFWDMRVEDNGFLLLRTATGQIASLHASWTEWKNLFSFEISGKLGKLEVSGLGGSYGLERLAFYQMSPKMGPPETTIWEYPMEDDSWESEFATFVEDIRRGRPPSPGIEDAQAALRIVERVYQENLPK